MGHKDVTATAAAAAAAAIDNHNDVKSNVHMSICIRVCY